MKRTFLLLTLLLLAAQLAPAQKGECQNDGPQRGACEQPTNSVKTSEARAPSSAAAFASAAVSAAAAPAPGPVSSQFQPKTPTDRRFVVNGGGGLDTGCTFRSGGPLRIELPIARVVGETDGEGRLSNPVGLIQNGIVPKGYVTLSMPAFDVDTGGSPPEVDVVYFNGQPIGQLTGGNGIWKENSWPIPIDMVRFGRQGSEGSPSTPGVNVIEIHIDQASGNEQNWCTQIDWAEVTFEAMYPVVMVHGNAQDSNFWTGMGFVEPFRQQMIPFDASISMNPDAADIHVQSGQLMNLIKARADQFGVKHLHLVAHSKGGLDVRDFLVRRIPELRGNGTELGILSLSTLSTPHHGSAGADYALDAEEISALLGVPNSQNPLRAALAKAMPTNDGHPHLRTDYVQRTFNPSNRPLPTTMSVDGETNPVSYFSFAADANLNRSRDAGGPTIQPNEMEGVEVLGISVSSIPYGTDTVQEVYRLMGTVASTDVVDHPTETNPLTGDPVRIIVENRYRGGFRLNDFLVTVDSARYPGFQAEDYVGANHATISRPFVANRVINVIRRIRW